MPPNDTADQLRRVRRFATLWKRYAAKLWHEARDDAVMLDVLERERDAAERECVRLMAEAAQLRAENEGLRQACAAALRDQRLTNKTDAMLRAALRASETPDA